jgi:Protein of unknown function (DUF2971)
MPVKAEENKKYLAFVEAEVATLQSLLGEADKNQLVWHYTTGDALINIVETGAFYATQVGCLNDSTEVRYGENLLRDAFLSLQGKGSYGQETQQLLEPIIKVNLEDHTQKQPSNWFVACFSKEKDDLSQWRAYGGGENGFAIAFLAGAFFGRGSLVVRVNYDKELHLSVAAKLAEATLQFFQEGLDARVGDAAAQAAWTNEFIQEWSGLIGQLAPMVKDPAFKDENEYRIVHLFKPDEMSKLRFRQKQSLMSIHLPLVFPPPTSATHSTLLPIMEVMVGPSRHKEVSRVSVDVLLRQRGYINIPVSMSSIPFQTT